MAGYEASEAEGFLKRLAQASKPSLSDEELLRAIIKEAKHDCFCGVGRIFVDEFVKWYGCPRERLLSILRKSDLKWRFGTTDNIVLINL